MHCSSLAIAPSWATSNLRLGSQTQKLWASLAAPTLWDGTARVAQVVARTTPSMNAG